VITGGSIDATCLLNGTAVSTALAAKANLSTQTTHCCCLYLNNDVGTTDTVTEAEIFTALGLTGSPYNITAAAYNILAYTVGITLYQDNGAGKFFAIAIDGTTVTAELAFTGTGVNALLSQIDFTGLAAGTDHYIALTFKIVSAT
jgi:hypothetical protein